MNSKTKPQFYEIAITVGGIVIFSVGQIQLNHVVYISIIKYYKSYSYSGEILDALHNLYDLIIVATNATIRQWYALISLVLEIFIR